jgi:2-hydroxy-6-oxonona-2,4-dienedioate hydrolase
MNLNIKTLGQGEPLVLLHGGLGSINHWQRNLDALAQHYTVHALDMPSYGESPAVPKDTPRDEYVGYVIDALDAIAPSGAFRLAGFSFGGMIAAACAARMGARIHKLSLLGPGGFERKGIELAMKKIPPASEGEAARRAVLRHNLEVMMCHGAHRVTEETIDLYWYNMQRARYDGRRISLTAGLMASCLKRIHCPVQIIWGEQDTLCDPLQDRIDEVRAVMPSIDTVIIPDAGHWVQYDAAHEVNRLLLAFLE